MRFFILSLPLLLSAVALPAVAQEASPQPMPPPGESAAAAPPPRDSTQKPVDGLFEALRRERDPEKAKGIASQIVAELNDSGSATINLLMQWSANAIKEKNNAAALDFLDRVTLLDPSFAEGWNRRATLHYTLGDRRKSMADVAEVLKHEPRHFGALAGMAGMLADAGSDELALRAWERYLDIYPADREAQEAAFTLSEKIAGNRT
jgi:tetratricopeptide (TPR) repeat protein